MKKHSLQMMIVVVLVLILTSGVFARVKTVYQTNNSIEIETKLGTQTVLFFDSEIEFAISNSNKFQIDNDKKNNKLAITPKKPGADTNLVVTTKDSEKYEFRLVEEDSSDYDSIVEVKPKPPIDYKDIINLVNKRKVTIDPAVKKLVNVYDIAKNRFKFEDPKLEIILKRVVTIQSKNKTVFWLRISNISKKKAVNIPVNSVDIKERERFAIALEDGKENLKPKEFTDYYIIVEGTGTDNSYTVLMNVNGKDKEYKIKNIPYNKQEFKVFVEDGDNYINVQVEDYQR